MNGNKFAGLKRTEFKKLCKLPDGEVVGEVIRLNQTLYQNSLDVLKICTLVRSNKRHPA
jgi:hypothetical protein